MNEKDKKLLEFVLKHLETTILILSKKTDLGYNTLYWIKHYGRKFSDTDLDILREYLMKESKLTEYYINLRINSLKKRNQQFGT